MMSVNDMDLQPHGELIDACSMFSGPECSNRNTSKDTTEDGPGGVDNDNTQHSPAGDLKPLCGEDSQILKQDRGLC
jgi:hypothetical protein